MIKPADLGRPWAEGLVTPGSAFLCFVVLALFLTSFLIVTVVPNPFFVGDFAHRMHMAEYPAIRLDNRVWLPILQIHIWVLMSLEL